MNKRESFEKGLVSTGYALLYQLIFVPILSIVSYRIFVTALSYTNDYMLETLLLAFMICFDIIAVYLISYLYNKYIKVDNIYHVVVGFITSFLSLIVMLYLRAAQSECVLLSSASCSTSILNYKFATFVFIFVLLFYVLFLLMNIVSKKQFNLDNKSKKKKK